MIKSIISTAYNKKEDILYVASGKFTTLDLPGGRFNLQLIHEPPQHLPLMVTIAGYKEWWVEGRRKTELIRRIAPFLETSEGIVRNLLGVIKFTENSISSIDDTVSVK